MATGGSEQMSDEIVNFKCTPCAEINKVREAVKYCVECQGYCCQACVDTHKAFPALKRHNLKDKSTLKSTVLTSDLPVVPTQTCYMHEIKLMDMYCENHDVVGCTSCMALDHRNCTDVQLIPDVIDTIFKTSLAHETSLKVQEMKSMMEKIKTSREQLLEELKKCKTRTVNEIREYRKEMEAVLEQLEEESIKEVEKHYQQLDSTLQEEKERAEFEIDILKKTAANLMKSEGNKAQQFVSVKIAQTIITKTKEKCHSLEENADARISFAPDSSIKNYLQQLKSLGSVNHHDIEPLQLRTSIYTIKSGSELNVKMQNDSKTCYIHGSCLTEDDELLLADYFNQKLKRIDIVRMCVVDHCDLQYRPYSVCQTGKQQAVVTFSNSIIQFVTLGNQMTTNRQMKLNHPCFGIACKCDKLYITDNGTWLYIHDMSGSLLHTVSKDNSGNTMFGNSRHMVFNDTDHNMFIADFGKGLVCLDEHNKHSFSFTDTSLSLATGVCVDGRGNILLSGFSSNNVIQIGQGGKNVGIIVNSSDGLKNPQSMCFDKRKCTLTVTQANSDIVKFFDLN